jgi:hypothetical protein
MFGPSARLFDKTTAGDPGGAGDGKGGKGDAGDGAGDDDNKPLTAADVTELVRVTVNQALSSKLSKAVQTAVTSALTTALPTAIEGLKTELGKGKGEGEGNPDPGDGTPPKPKKGDPETEALRAQVAKLLAGQKAIEEKAEAATKKARNDRALAQLVAELGEVTSSPAVAKVVAQNMLLVDNKVDFDDNGEPLLKHTRPAYTGGPMEDVLLSIKDGVSQWAKQEDAAPFIKPPTTQSGGKGAGGGFGKSRQVPGGTAPKLNDPGGVEVAVADLQAQIDARQGRAG